MRVELQKLLKLVAKFNNKAAVCILIGHSALYILQNRYYTNMSNGRSDAFMYYGYVKLK